MKVAGKIDQRIFLKASVDRSSVGIISFLTLLLTFTFQPGIAQTRDSTLSKTSLQDSVFTSAQVMRGAKYYEKACVRCHLPAQFTGPGFLSAWNGRTVDALYTLIQTTMPQDRPGQLKKQACADILAYLFSMNGLPSGKTELPSSLPQLKKIRIEDLPKRREKK